MLPNLRFFRVFTIPRIWPVLVYSSPTKFTSFSPHPVMLDSKSVGRWRVPDRSRRLWSMRGSRVQEVKRLMGFGPGVAVQNVPPAWTLAVISSP
jgi:hypothetical protein